MVREMPLMQIASTFTLEYYLLVLEFLVENISEHKALVESMSFPTMISTEVWVLHLYLRWGLVHKRQLDNRVFDPLLEERSDLLLIAWE